MARAAACQAVVEAICKAHIKCNEGTTYTHPSGRIVHDRPTEVTFPKYEDCTSGVGCGTGNHRPPRQSVAKPDVQACLDAVQAGSKDSASCKTYTTDDYPNACGTFFSEVNAADYLLDDASKQCAPGYLRQENTCLVACESDGDCWATNEICADAKTCQTSRRCDRDGDCPSGQVCGTERNSSGNRICQHRHP